MKVRRRGNDDGVDFLGGGNFVEGVRADEKLRGIDSAKAFGLLELVKVGASGVELVLKHVGKRDHARPSSVDEIRGVLGAASAAAKHAHADGGVRGGTANQGRLDEHEAGGGRGRADEFTAVEFVCGVLTLICVA